MKNFPICPKHFVLERTEGRLQLCKLDESRLGAIFVDFVTGSTAHRRKYGGGRGQAIVKAIGMKKGVMPSVVDATAGLGRDAFVLASLGCRVHMIERSEVLFALLEDGLKRAKSDAKIGPWVSTRLTLSQHDNVEGWPVLPFQPDVVYLDPMFPEKRKSALVKKEMQVLKALIGFDEDADALLPRALEIAKKRVVVKRPAHAQCLGNKLPDTAIKTTKNRFDIYLINT